MSRLHPTLQHSDILSNCEAYMSNLLKKKSDKNRVVTRERPTCRTSNPAPVQRILNTRSSIVPFVKHDNKPESLHDQELVHKEVLNNKMAQVEVTVRTVSTRNRSRSNSVSLDKREPWGRLLQSRKSNEALLPSNNFDYALGTIHFLSKELQQKLQMICPGDPSLQQIVNDIQHTLYRLGPDIISGQDNFPLPKDNCVDTDFSNAKKEYLEKVMPKFLKVSQSTQTILIGDSENNVQRHFDDTVRKLETTCKQLESECNKLKTEKDDMELHLGLEKDMVKKLKQEIEEMTTEKNETSLKVMKQLQEERDALENQLKQSVQNSHENNTQEMHNLVQKLREDNSTIEYENINMKHELTIMKLEKEKMTFLLESRDKQLKALRTETEAIQSLVCTQLMDLKSSSYSPTTSRCSLETKSWKTIKKSDKKDNPVQELFLNKMKTHYQHFVPDTVSSTIMNDLLSKRDTRSSLKSRDYQDEFPQRDVTMPKVLKKFSGDPKNIPSDFTITSENPDYMKEDLESNIKDMFAELKRQALVVTLSSPQPQQFKDASSVDSHTS